MTYSISRSTINAVGFAAMVAFATPGFAADAAKATYDAAKARAEANYEAAKERCESFTGNSKDVCQKQAKAEKEKAQANAKAEHKGDAKSHNDAHLDAAKADYQVAKERCDALNGNAKDVCIKDAKATLASAQGRSDMGEARMDANKDASKAEYQVQKEKCDAMTGDAKDACIAEAKMHRVN
jgi:hypothetical protein